MSKIAGEPDVLWLNAEVFSQGRGKWPWHTSDVHPRVMLDANEAIVGMMDTADLAARVVAVVNRGESQ